MIRAVRTKVGCIWLRVENDSAERPENEINYKVRCSLMSDTQAALTPQESDVRRCKIFKKCPRFPSLSPTPKDSWHMSVRNEKKRVTYIHTPFTCNTCLRGDTLKSLSNYLKEQAKWHQKGHWSFICCTMIFFSTFGVTRDKKMRSVLNSP